MKNKENIKFKEKVQFSYYTKIVFYVFSKIILKNNFKKHKVRACLFTLFLKTDFGYKKQGKHVWFLVLLF